jgi:hypothetical protein
LAIGRRFIAMMHAILRQSGKDRFGEFDAGSRVRFVRARWDQTFFPK